MKFISKIVLLIIAFTILVSNAIAEIELRKRLTVRDGEGPNSVQLRVKVDREDRVVEIPNGAVVLYRSTGPIANMIGIASAANVVPNPLRVTHAGLIIIENPRVLYNMVLALKESRESSSDTKYPLPPLTDSRESSSDTKNQLPSLTEKQVEYVLQMLEDNCRALLDQMEDPEIYCVFSLESYGTLDEVIGGIGPDVRLYYFPERIKKYSGNIFYRPFKDKQISQVQTRQFIQNNLGRRYINPLKPEILLCAVGEENTGNDTGRVFCSELVVLFLQACSLIAPEVVASNIIPEKLCSRAVEYDILRGICGLEICLNKSIVDFEEESECKRACAKGFICCLKRVCCIGCCTSRTSKPQGPTASDAPVPVPPVICMCKSEKTPASGFGEGDEGEIRI